MKKLLIFILIIATLVGVFMMPTGSATSVDGPINEGDGSVEYVGDTLVSEKITAEYAWSQAFSVFTQLREAYYGTKEYDELNVKVTMNIAGSKTTSEYERGIFHDVWPDSVVDEDATLLYKDVYFANGGSGYQYGDGNLVEINPGEEGFFRPAIIDIIEEYNLTDINYDWRKIRYTYDEENKVYVRDGYPSVWFKDGKVANIMSVLSGPDGHYLCEVTFEYGDAIIPLPSRLGFMRPEGQIPSVIGNTFGAIDYNVAKLMNRIAKSGIGKVVTFLMEAISLLTENGIIFFIAAIIMVFFVKTRKAGILMFVSLAIGVVLTNMVLKGSIMRYRPFETNTIYYEFWKDVGCPGESGYSFPSGHTTAVMAAAVAFFVSFKKKYSWLGIFAVLAVGVSRVYLMAHYTSDVIAGVLVGGISGILAIYVTKLIYHLIGHYEDSVFTKAVLTKDVTFRRKKEEVVDAQPVLVAETPEAPVAIDAEAQDATADNWEEKLLTLMTEVRDLLKEGKVNKEDVAKVLDDVEHTIKTDDK